MLFSNAVDCINADGRSRFVLVCEHASASVPLEYTNFFLSAEQQNSHVAWDIGALALAREVSSILDAPLIAGRYSRLLYDCNRAPDAHDAIANETEMGSIPGNSNLCKKEIALRVEHIYIPFHNLVHKVLDKTRNPILVTIHSFSPVFAGARREFDIGILHDSDARFANACLSQQEVFAGYAVRRNQPYGQQDNVMHTLQRHGLRRGVYNTMIEVRNTLLQNSNQVTDIAVRITRMLYEATRSLDGDNKKEETRDDAIDEQILQHY